MDSEIVHESENGVIEVESPNLEPKTHKPSVPKRLIVAGICLALMLVSFFVLGAHFTNPASYPGTIEYLTGRQQSAVALSALSMTASTAITVLPGDIGITLADQLANLSSSMIIVTISVFLLKYLLTAFGFLATRVFFPIALLAFAMWFAFDRDAPFIQGVMALGRKLAVLGVVLLITIPGSVAVSKNVEDVHRISSEQSVASIEAKYAQQKAEAETKASESSKPEKTGNIALDFWNSVKSAAGNAIDSAKSAATEKYDYAKAMFNDLIDAFAVLVVTTCIVPVLTLVFLLWISGWILGINTSGAFSAIGAGRKKIAGGISKGNAAVRKNLIKKK